MAVPGRCRYNSRCDIHALADDEAMSDPHETIPPSAGQTPNSGQASAPGQPFLIGRYRVELAVRSTDAAVGQQLIGAGFSQGNSGFLRVVEGSF